MRSVPAHGKEIKTVDTNVSSLAGMGQIVATLNTNENAACLNLIQQGTADYNRVGKSVNMKSLRIRGTLLNIFNLPALSNSDYTEKYIRMVVVHLKNEESAYPGYNVLFGEVDQRGAVFNQLTSPVVPYKLNEVTVLRDVMLKITQDNPMLGINDEHYSRCHFDEYIPLKGLQTVYRGTNDPLAISSVQSGAIVVYFRATSDVGNDYCGLESCHARLRYEDN